MTYNQIADLGFKFDGTETLSRDEVDLLLDLDDENSRKGNFESIFPVASNIAHYLYFFE